MADILLGPVANSITRQKQPQLLLAKTAHDWENIWKTRGKTRGKDSVNHFSPGKWDSSIESGGLTHEV